MDFLKNITEGKAFVRTEKGLVGVGAGECIEKAKVLDVQALLATKIFIESDGTEPEKEVADPEKSEDEKEVAEPEKEVADPEKSEDEKEVAEPEKEVAEVKAPVAKPKAQAPKCAKKINKPALD